MRSIRQLRAWDEHSRTWVYSGKTPAMMVAFWQWVAVNFEAPLYEETGLKDKNGVEIYEGDILRHDELHHTTKGVVEFFNNLIWDGSGSLHSGFYCKEWFDDWGNEGELSWQLGFDKCEVIGNIYENPDLLK